MYQPKDYITDFMAFFTSGLSFTRIIRPKASNCRKYIWMVMVFSSTPITTKYMVQIIQNISFEKKKKTIAANYNMPESFQKHFQWFKIKYHRSWQIVHKLTFTQVLIMTPSIANKRPNKTHLYHPSNYWRSRPYFASIERGFQPWHKFKLLLVSQHVGFLGATKIIHFYHFTVSYSKQNS